MGQMRQANAHDRLLQPEQHEALPRRLRANRRALILLDLPFATATSWAVYADGTAFVARRLRAGPNRLDPGGGWLLFGAEALISTDDMQLAMDGLLAALDLPGNEPSIDGCCATVEVAERQRTFWSPPFAAERSWHRLADVIALLEQRLPAGTWLGAADPVHGVIR